MKKLIDVIRSIVLAMPTKVQLTHTDRYIDNSLVVVAAFGLAAAYVMTPDGKVTAAWQKGDLTVDKTTTLATALDTRRPIAMTEQCQVRWSRSANGPVILPVHEGNNVLSIPQCTRWRRIGIHRNDGFGIGIGRSSLSGWQAGRTRGPSRTVQPLRRQDRPEHVPVTRQRHATRPPGIATLNHRAGAAQQHASDALRSAVQ